MGVGVGLIHRTDSRTSTRAVAFPRTLIWLIAATIQVARKDVLVDPDATVDGGARERGRWCHAVDAEPRYGLAGRAFDWSILGTSWIVVKRKARPLRLRACWSGQALTALNFGTARFSLRRADAIGLHCLRIALRRTAVGRIVGAVVGWRARSNEDGSDGAEAAKDRPGH